MKRTYKIAGLSVNMDYTYGRFPMTIPYETEDTDRPDLTVQPDYVGINKTADELKTLPRDRRAFMEHNALAADFYHQLLDFGGCMIHSSAVIMEGKAYLFTADSGTGKSSHVAMYRRVYGDDRVRILNDDKPAVRLEDGQFYAYGTPWSGKTELNLNLRVPLAGICLLRRGETNTIRRMHPREALFALLGQTIRPKEKGKMDKLMDTLGSLITRVPVWEMHCNLELDAPRVSYEAMSGMRKEDET